MEPNIKRVTLKRCASQEEARRELIKGLLTNESEPMSLQVLVTILQSDPYGLTPQNVVEALNELNNEGLLRIEKFTMGTWLAKSRVDVALTLVR